ncbi:COX15/CtaA family protein [Lentisphaera profundi]|uniref:COX15/CtaA family protein n=1 Tax=Lentisphaera profundi TaxID=1658616 RepID=A0ABY7VZ73_9BACT|nr:COX15/CtaA family protein [Lentisphaera profundi]WDE99094.1 COX15/CtaA family protein [Lentisphaera profundi]
MRPFTIIVIAMFIAILIGANQLYKNTSDAKKNIIYKALLWTLLSFTVGLIYMGAMTVSTRSGMAFPDWPTSDGVLWPSLNYFMSETDRFYEHVHRLLGEFVGFLAIMILLFSRHFEKERNFKLSLIIFIMVCVQGGLGGLTVSQNTLWLTTVLHGVFAQLCLAAMCYLVLKNTKLYNDKLPEEGFSPKLKGLAKFTLGAVLVQLLLGAIFRNKAKVFDFSDKGKVIYKELVEGNAGWLFSHMTFALPVAILLFTLGVVIMKFKNLSKAYKFFGMAFHLLVTMQILLGVVAFFTVYNREEGKFGFAETVLTSGHVVNGALILALTFTAYKLLSAKVNTGPNHG